MLKSLETKSTTTSSQCERTFKLVFFTVLVTLCALEKCKKSSAFVIGAKMFCGCGSVYLKFSLSIFPSLQYKTFSFPHNFPDNATPRHHLFVFPDYFDFELGNYCSSHS